MRNVLERIPPFTLSYMGTSLAIAILITMRILSPTVFILDFTKVFYNFQIWRLFTCYFLAGGFSIGLFFHMLFSFLFLPNMERLYANRKADLVVMLVFLWACIMLFSFIPNYHQVMTEQFLESLIYISCRFQKDVVYSIWGIPVQAPYLPFVRLGMNLLMGQSIIPDIIGLLAGHSYYFLKYICLENYNKDYLPSPRFLSRMFRDEGFRANRQENFPAPGDFPRPGNFNAFAGRGHVLG